MRKCQAATNPECFAPCSFFCSDCNAWYCEGHADAHAKEVHAMREATGNKELVPQLLELAKRYNVVIWYRDSDKDQYEVYEATPVKPG